MPGENIYDWSTTAANNDTADSLINWREGMPRAAVNDSARSLMAAHAKNRNLLNGTIITGGTANAQIFTSGVGYTGVVPTGLRVLLKIGPGLTNTTSATLNMDGIGDVTIKSRFGTDLTSGELTADAYTEFCYNGTNWILWQDNRPYNPGGRVLLSKTIASNSATIDLIGLDGVDYEAYEIIITNMTATFSSTIPRARFSIDNGATFITAANYQNLVLSHSVIGTGTGPATVFAEVNPTSLNLGVNMDANTVNPPSRADMFVRFVTGVDRVANLFYDTTFYHASASGLYVAVGRGTNTALTGINALRFFQTTGNIATGNFSVYGIRR